MLRLLTDNQLSRVTNPITALLPAHTLVFIHFLISLTDNLINIGVSAAGISHIYGSSPSAADCAEEMLVLIDMMNVLINKAPQIAYSALVKSKRKIIRRIA